MPSPSRSLDLNSRYYAFIADWLSALLFSMVTGIDDDAEVIDFMFSPEYHAVYSGVFELVCSPYQTPFTLFQIIVFCSRFYSRLDALLAPAEFGSTDVVEEFQAILRIFYLMALQAMGNATLSGEEQLYISGLATLSEYRSVKQKLTRVLTSRRTGTIEIGHVEWETYLVDICRVMVPLPYGDMDRIDMQATIDALLGSMQFTSSMGNVPLSELVFQPFPRYSHRVPPSPPLFSDVSPLLLDFDFDPDRVSLSTSSFAESDFLYPTSHSSFSAPSLAAFPEWNPSADPIVECGPRRAKNIAPGSDQAVYDLDGIESANPMSLCNLVHGYGLLRLHQPRPKRVIKVDLIELEASLQEDSSLLLTTELHMTKVRDTLTERRCML